MLLITLFSDHHNNQQSSNHQIINQREAQFTLCVIYHIRWVELKRKQWKWLKSKEYLSKMSIDWNESRLNEERIVEITKRMNQFVLITSDNQNKSFKEKHLIVESLLMFVDSKSFGNWMKQLSISKMITTTSLWPVVPTGFSPFFQTKVNQFSFTFQQQKREFPFQKNRMNFISFFWNNFLNEIKLNVHFLRLNKSFLFKN